MLVARRSTPRSCYQVSCGFPDTQFERRTALGYIRWPGGRPSRLGHPCSPRITVRCDRRCTKGWSPCGFHRLLSSQPCGSWTPQVHTGLRPWQYSRVFVGPVQSSRLARPVGLRLMTPPEQVPSRKSGTVREWAVESVDAWGRCRRHSNVRRHLLPEVHQPRSILLAEQDPSR